MAGPGAAAAALTILDRCRTPPSHFDVQAVAEWVAREALNASSPYAPYLASMPTLRDASHTLSYESFPLAYLHLLQDGGPLVRAWVLRHAWEREMAVGSHGQLCN